MRKNNDIATLDARRTSIEYPKPTAAFDGFRRALREVLEANEVPGSWDWDPYEQTWCASWEYDGHFTMFDGKVPFAVEFQRGVTIDPAKPIGEEIERLLEEYKQFVATCNVFTRGGAKALIEGVRVDTAKDADKSTQVSDSKREIAQLRALLKQSRTFVSDALERKHEGFDGGTYGALDAPEAEDWLTDVSQVLD